MHPWAGGSVGYKDDGQLPNIKGDMGSWGNWTANYAESALYGGDLSSWGAPSSPSQQHNNGILFDANRYSSAYSRYDNFVLPRRLNVYHIIKY